MKFGNLFTDETVVDQSIYIQDGSDPMFGSEQEFISYPRRIPTVSFYLADTGYLNEIADNLIVEDGHRPRFYQVEGYNGELDMDGWYDFYVGVNGYEELRLDNCIVVEPRMGDEKVAVQYLIELSKEEKKNILNKLNKECIEVFEKDLNQLMKEAKDEMKEAYLGE